MSEAPKRKGLRKSINDKCKQCIYHSTNEGGSWRQQVEACTVKSCGLWDVRPVSIGSKNEEVMVDDAADMLG
jgi:hypothetical protein